MVEFPKKCVGCSWNIDNHHCLRSLDGKECCPDYYESKDVSFSCVVGEGFDADDFGFTYKEEF